MSKPLPGPVLRVMTSVYLSTDCSNGVYDYAILHHTRRSTADRLCSEGLLSSSDEVVRVNGDGGIIQPERHTRGYRLTVAGYEALTSHDREAYPATARRFA